jgi:5-methyltetrahydrofolate--homocysteine methyltransferase
MVPIIAEIMDAAEGLPVIAQPNAGQPQYRGGKSVYEVTVEEFSSGAEKLLDLGVSLVGGCCGTTPAMISAVRGIIDKRRNEK